MAATVHPSVVPPITDSGNSCTIGLSDPQECTAIVGSGLNITSISGTFKNRTSNEIDDVIIFFYGPNGNITSTATYDVPGGKSIGPFVWHNPNPNATMTPGDYCTEAESPAIDVADCVDVHS
jgi:hypothetical protein